MANLTDKQKKFANEYIKTGDAAKSYIKIYGCKQKVAEANSSRLLSNAKICEHIEQMNKKLEKSTIADMTEIKEFWTKLFREGIQTVRLKDNDIELPVDVKDRLKASEYIAKTNAAFIEKVEHSGTLGVKIVDDIK